jgi:hypothetical protein
MPMNPQKGFGASSAGTTDTRVDRPSEGLPGVANLDNPTANPPTRAVQDIGMATGFVHNMTRGNIDTTQTSGLTPDQDIKRGNPAAWV